MTNNKPPRLKSLYSSREESAHRTFTQIKAVALSVLGTLRMNPALSISDSIYLCSDKRLRLTGGIRLSVPRWLRRTTMSNKLLIGCGVRFDQNTHVKERTQYLLLMIGSMEEQFTQARVSSCLPAEKHNRK